MAMARIGTLIPNFSCGPCLYCNKISEANPEELLRCDICKRAAHFGCLRSGIPQNRLFGDNFFLFTCIECSPSSTEIVIRAKLTFVQVLLLALYILHTKRASEAKDGYFHYKIHIHAFLRSNFKKLYSYDGKNYYKEKRKLQPNCVSGQLSQCPYFIAKRIGRGRGGWYKLSSVVPPAVFIHENQRKLMVARERIAADCQLEDDTKLEREFCGFPDNSSSSVSTTSNNSDVIHKDDVIRKDDITRKDDLFLEDRSRESTKSLESVDDSSRGSWFMERAAVRIEQTLPSNIFDEEDLALDIEELPAEKEATPQITKPAIKLVSLFSHASDDGDGERESITKEKTAESFAKERLVPISLYEERKLLKRLDQMKNLSPRSYRLRRKLKFRQTKREHNLPLFNIDAEVSFLETNKRLMTESERIISLKNFSYSCEGENERILDRFQVCDRNYLVMKKEQMSFRTKLIGAPSSDRELIHSPFSLRNLKPFIFRDSTTTPLKLKLLQEILSYSRVKRNKGSQCEVVPTSRPAPRRSIDYCYVTPKHIPAMNYLAREFFWPGIDLSEVLHYPDFTCVVLYGHLVIGFGVLVPDTQNNEAYVSFILVQPEWRRAGIGKFILYHLVQTCPGRDIVLHVSATNPALIMYQEFGFKVEEFLSDFYDKYLPEDSPECKHAMFLRLRR